MISAVIYDIDESLQKHSTVSSADIMQGATTDFGEDLPPNYATFENNGSNFYDNGSVLCDAGDYIGYLSSSASDETGAFEIPVTMDIQPTWSGNCSGITICFWQHYCTELKVEYFYDNEKRFENHCSPDKLNYFIEFEDEYWDKITITFYKTQYPNSLIKIANVYFGNLIITNRFTQFSLTNEINPISDDLAINTCNFNAVFYSSPIEQKGNKMQIFNGNALFGSYRIKNIVQQSQNIYEFQSEDIIGSMDFETYFGSDTMSQNAVDMITELFSSDTSVQEIEIDPLFNDVTVYGWIPQKSKRYALMQICWAIGAIVQVTPSGKVRILPNSSTASSVISSADKRIIGDAKFEKSHDYASIEWKSVEYCAKPQSEYENLYSISVLDADPEDGKNIYIEFDKPTSLDVMSTSSRVVNFNTRNFLDMTCSNGSYYLYGFEYLENEVPISVVRSDYDSRIKDIKNFTGFTLVGKRNGSVDFKKNQLQKYIDSKGKVKARIIVKGEKVGDLITIETAFSGTVTGMITRMNYISVGYDMIADIEVMEWQIG